MSENVLFCVIFEQNVRFIDEFVEALNLQTTKNFEVFFVNDGVNPDFLKDKLNLLDCTFKISTVPPLLTIAQVREYGIKELLKYPYRNVIFADTDDLMSGNRIERSVDLLNDSHIVFNDLTLIDVNRFVVKKKIWNDRLINIKVSKLFLLDKNVLGLGNTAVRANLLHNLVIPKEIIAVDWFIFSLIIKNFEAKFIDDVETYYRQYDSNLIGCKQQTAERLNHIIKVKKNHYKNSLMQDSFRFLSEISLIEKRLENEIFLQDILSILKNKELNYFWWEELNYINKY